MKNEKRLPLHRWKHYYETWLEQDDGRYDRNVLVERFLNSRIVREEIDPFKQEIYRAFFTMLVGTWGRAKETLKDLDERQLVFSGEGFEPYRVPLCLKMTLPNRDEGVKLLRALDSDWLIYLPALKANVDKAALQYNQLNHFYEVVLRPIFTEFPGIDTETALNIAVERGILVPLKREDGRIGSAGLLP